MSLLVIAYPELEKKDVDHIQHHRKQYDQLFYNVVDPHFTFVFPVSGFSKEEFIEEVKKQTSNSQVISFSLGPAVMHKDELSAYYYNFLVPEKGNQEIINLHNKLYSGAFQTALIKEISYKPHITIGNHLQDDICNDMVMNWNKNNYSIQGIISNLSIVEYNNGTITELARVRLII